MKNCKKNNYAFIFYIMFFFSYSSNGQTKIAPVLGFDWIEPNKEIVIFSTTYDMAEKKYKRQGVIIGVNLNQTINKIISLNYSFLYHNKRVFFDYTEMSFFPPDQLYFNYRSHNFSIDFYLHKNIIIGLGYKWRNLYDANKKRLDYDYDIWSSQQEADENGIQIITGVELLKSVKFELYYYHGLLSNGLFSSSRDRYLVSPTRSLGFKAKYMFKLFDEFKIQIKSKESKTKCPKF